MLLAQSSAVEMWSTGLQLLKHVAIILLLQVLCLPAVPTTKRLHSSRCCAFSLSCPYPSSIIQSLSLCLGLPLFPSILPSIISLCRDLPLRMCQIQFFCLVLTISIKDHFSSTFF